ncbi:MAG: energy transducer TonB [Maribacter sp.]|nr:energy transducer TonB [Maribacter sp.]
MKLKKNPKKDVNRNGGIRFLMALTVVLLLTYLALEWRTYDTTYDYDTAMNVVDDLTEEVPITKMKTFPPPPPPKVPQFIEVASDDPEILETIIATTEVFPDQIIAVDSISVEEFVENPEIPFAIIENVPVFPDCEDEKDKRGCFQKMIGKHIAKNFKYPPISQEMGIQGKVYVTFIIQKDGSIGSIQLRGPDKNLEAEAARIIGKLPMMQPGKQRGTPVKVPFSIPITFKLQ